jgi:signal transduction histidine kinase/CheY-like chemotaxis protein
VQASLALTTEVSLERVLQKITEVARDLLGARHAALGVIDESGTGLSQLLTAGIDEPSKRAIGPLPTGMGMLGLLMTERRPLRIRNLASHPQPAAFPANHPPVGSFLGVPIMARDKAYGSLYVTEKQGAEEFSEADEGLAVVLASQAAIAIENAYTFRALHEAQEELVRKEKLAMLGQLAGGVGHELRNPLGVIKNSVYYLNMILPPDEKVQKHLRILDREVANSDRIVTDLLDFARVKIPVREGAHLGTIVRAALERLPLPESVTVQLELSESMPAVLVDAQQVEQILLNFLQNAVQAMPDGGRVTVSTGEDRETAFAAVEDTGVGVPPENLAKIFQPLFTTKAKGIGLGLALVRDLAGANGGRITLESTVGQGSRFAVHFEKAAPGPRKTILVVDDDIAMTDTLTDIFQANHYEVAIAHSGDAAVSMTRRRAYDLVLMDIQMPGLNGVQALTAMKAEGLAERVIMMTAHTNDELVREAEKRSGSPVLPKPLDLERVLALAASATSGQSSLSGRAGADR